MYWKEAEEAINSFDKKNLVSEYGHNNFSDEDDMNIRSKGVWLLQYLENRDDKDDYIY